MKAGSTNQVMKRNIYLVAFGIAVALVSLTLKPKEMNQTAQSFRMTVSSPIKASIDVGVRKIARSFMKLSDKKE